MSKKLPLPDYRDVHTVWGNSFPRDKAEGLAAQFPFKPEYDLYEELNEAASWLDMFHPASRAQREKAAREGKKGVKGFRAGVGDTAPKVRREELQELQKRGEDFLESLRKLGHHARLDLDRNALNVPQGRVDLQQLWLEVHLLVQATHRSLESLSAAKPGRPAKDVEALFAAQVRKIYREGTGRNDKPKHDRESNAYYGDYYEFFTQCMNAVGLYKGDRQLARLADEACKGEDVKAGPKIEE